MKNITQKCHLCVLFLDLTFCKNLGFFLSEHCELLLVTESRCRQVLPCFQIVIFLILSWNTGTTGPKGKIQFGYSRSPFRFTLIMLSSPIFYHRLCYAITVISSSWKRVQFVYDLRCNNNRWKLSNQLSVVNGKKRTKNLVEILKPKSWSLVGFIATIRTFYDYLSSQSLREITHYTLFGRD